MPILFIHTKDDELTPFEPVEKIAKQARYPHHWWIDHGGHANAYLKHQQEYKDQIISFVQSIINR